MLKPWSKNLVTFHAASEFLHLSTEIRYLLSHRVNARSVLSRYPSPTAKDMAGFSKVQQACAVARSDRFDYIWIDSCCIDKTSSAELSEAINLMYHWYKEAQVCYTYLADVQYQGEIPENELYFTESRWLIRGVDAARVTCPVMQGILRLGLG